MAKKGEVRGPGPIGVEKQDQETPVFVRFSKELMGVVDRAVSEVGSRKAFLERLIDAFGRASETEQDAILKRDHAFKTVGNQLAEESWSAHAFALQHWPWAVSCYRLVAEKARKFNSQELLGFALYREGYAWNELGLGLRRHALKLGKQCPRETWVRDFDAAIDCIERGIECTGDMPGQAAVPRSYNLACGHSQLAQLAVEQALKNDDGPWAVELSDEAKGNGDPLSKPWNDIGQGWRALLTQSKKAWGVQFQTPVNLEKVDMNARMSIKFLRDTSNPATNEGTSPVPWPDPEFFKRLAHRDSDLIFIREDSEARVQFNLSFGPAHHGADDEWYFNSYQSLRQAISTKAGTQ